MIAEYNWAVMTNDINNTSFNPHTNEQTNIETALTMPNQPQPLSTSIDPITMVDH